MAQSTKDTDFVSIVAQEISSGIDRALAYWLGRIELELLDASFTTTQRMAAIEAIIREYKQCAHSNPVGLASA